MTLFDSKIYELHQNRSAKIFAQHRFLFDHVGHELIARLKDLKRTFLNPLILSPHPLSYKGNHDSHFKEILTHPSKSYDLILSCLQAHWVNNMPKFLSSLRETLKPEGLFLGALWGGHTLCELRESLLQAEVYLTGGAAPRLAPMLHPADGPTLLQRSGFFMPVVDSEMIHVTYPSLISLMKDLRGMGETNKLIDRPKNFTSRSLFKKTEEIYLETFGDKKGRLSATFQVIYLTGWKSPEKTP